MATPPTLPGRAMSSQTAPFTFESHHVRVVLDDKGDPWFVAVDVCAALNHSNASVALNRQEADERGVSDVYTPGGPQKMSTVSEAGVYRLVFTSRIAGAERSVSSGGWPTRCCPPSARLAPTSLQALRLCACRSAISWRACLRTAGFFRDEAGRLRAYPTECEAGRFTHRSWTAKHTEKPKAGVQVRVTTNGLSWLSNQFAVQPGMPGQDHPPGRPGGRWHRRRVAPVAATSSPQPGEGANGQEGERLHCGAQHRGHGERASIHRIGGHGEEANKGEDVGDGWRGDDWSSGWGRGRIEVHNPGG